MDKDEQNQQCFLCRKPAGSSKHQTTNTIGNTQYTFADVLEKVFKKEQLPPKLTDQDFSKGVLCFGCKDMVDDLFRLQHELRGVKNEIVNTFKKSQKSEKKKNETNELTADENINKETTVNKKDKNKARENIQQETIKDKKVPAQPKDDVYIIESLKEKKGNQFLVKWQNYSEDENTWEPKLSIPECILQVSQVILKLTSHF